MNRRAFVHVSGASVLSFGLAGCLGTGEDGADGSDTETGGTTAGSGDEAGATGDPDLQGQVLESKMTDLLAIRETELYRQDDNYGVRGIVENTGQRPMTNVEVHVRLIDPEGGLLGQFSESRANEAEVWGLDPGQVDNFEILFEDTDPATVGAAARYEVWADGMIE